MNRPAEPTPHLVDATVLAASDRPHRHRLTCRAGGHGGGELPGEHPLLVLELQGPVDRRTARRTRPADERAPVRGVAPAVRVVVDVAGVARAVAIGVDLVRVGDRRAVVGADGSVAVPIAVTDVTRPVTVRVGLVGVGQRQAVVGVVGGSVAVEVAVALVADRVAVEVQLVGVGQPDAVVAVVLGAVTVPVADAVGDRDGPGAEPRRRSSVLPVGDVEPPGGAGRLAVEAAQRGLGLDTSRRGTSPRREPPPRRRRSTARPGPPLPDSRGCISKEPVTVAPTIRVSRTACSRRWDG